MMSAEIDRETTTYFPFATKNVSAIAPAEAVSAGAMAETFFVANGKYVHRRRRGRGRGRGC